MRRSRTILPVDTQPPDCDRCGNTSPMRLAGCVLGCTITSGARQSPVSVCLGSAGYTRPPGGTGYAIRFNELCLKSTNGQIAARLVEARDVVDVMNLLREVRVPTLVLHAQHDELVPVEEGQLLASEIPGAEFIELDSRNHVLLGAEPAWGRFCEAVLSFCGSGGAGAARDRGLHL